MGLRARVGRRPELLQAWWDRVKLRPWGSVAESGRGCKIPALHNAFAVETGPENSERAEKSSWLSKLQTKSSLDGGLAPSFPLCNWFPLSTV